MDSSQLKPLASLVALLVLTGCASVPKTSAPSSSATSDVASIVGNAGQGAEVALPGGNPLGLDTVIVDRTYFSASGLECRRLLKADSTPIQRVTCKGQDGMWRFARDLKTSSVANAPFITVPASFVADEPLVEFSEETIDGDVAASVDDSAEASIELVANEASANDLSATEEPIVPFSVNINETMWSFAKRTTGNALNWKAIAEHNGISNAETLASGAVLNVPAELVREGE